MIASTQAPVGSDPFVAVLVAAVVLIVGLRVSRRIARVQGDTRFVKILMWSLVVHLLCAPAQIFIVDHLYNGVADYSAYVNRGAALAHNLRSGMFTFSNTRITGFTGDNIVYIASGVVQTVIGPNKLGEFFFFSGVAFLGEVCFLHAFSTTFPEVNPRRYAFLIFFLPSLLFWTADISKETIMTLALGIAAYGAARVLMRVKGGYRLLFVGVAIGIILRPNEVVLFLAGLALAMLFRTTDVKKRLRGTRKVLTFVTVVGGLAVAVVLYEKIFHESGSPTAILQQLHSGNSSESCSVAGKQLGVVLVEPALLPEGRLHRHVRSIAHNGARQERAVGRTGEHGHPGAHPGVAPPAEVRGPCKQAPPLRSSVHRLLGALHVRLRGSGKPRAHLQGTDPVAAIPACAARHPGVAEGRATEIPVGEARPQPKRAQTRGRGGAVLALSGRGLLRGLEQFPVDPFDPARRGGHVELRAEPERGGTQLLPKRLVAH